MALFNRISPEVPVNQSLPVYDMASALESLEPSRTQHLPHLDPVARRHFIHLVTGIIEQQSLLLPAIAAGRPFQAEPESNYTQVQRIIRHTRLSLETVYYPFLTQLLATLPGDPPYVTMDQTNHGTDFNLVLVGWATDRVSLPLGFVVYGTDAPWAEEARVLRQRLETLIPPDRTIVLLADRVHTGDPFLTCLDDLGWGYVIRLPEDTNIATAPDEWAEVRHLRQRAGRLRVFTNVRIWKGSMRRATVCLYRQRAADGNLHKCVSCTKPDVVMHSGTLSSFVIRFFALRAKKRITDEMPSTLRRRQGSAQSRLCKSHMELL
jgi:Transposase DDE domain